MKSILRRMAPSGAMNALRAAESRAKLAATPKRGFDARNLRSASALDLPAVFSSDAAAQAWDAGAGARAEALGSGEIDGGVNPGDRRAIFHLTYALAPRRILEVGSHVGASTTVIAQALAALGASASIASVDIVDINASDGPWAAAGLPEAPAPRVARIAPKATLRCVATTAEAYFSAADGAAADGPFDLIFLDGDHRAPAVYGELASALPCLAPDGVVLLHDFHPRGVSVAGAADAAQGPWIAAERIAREAPELEIRPLGALPWPTKGGSRHTSLAVALRRH